MPKPTHAPSAGPHSAHQFDEDDDENGEQIEGTLFNNSWTHNFSFFNKYACFELVTMSMQKVF